MLLTTLTMGGCTSKQIIYEDRVVKKIIATPCVLPEVKCYIDSNSTLTEKVDGIMECLAEHELVLKTYRAK